MCLKVECKYEGFKRAVRERNKEKVMIKSPRAKTQNANTLTASLIYLDIFFLLAQTNDKNPNREIPSVMTS